MKRTIILLLVLMSSALIFVPSVFASVEKAANNNAALSAGGSTTNNDPGVIAEKELDIKDHLNLDGKYLDKNYYLKEPKKEVQRTHTSNRDLNPGRLSSRF